MKSTIVHTHTHTIKNGYHYLVILQTLIEIDFRRSIQMHVIKEQARVSASCSMPAGTLGLQVHWG